MSLANISIIAAFTKLDYAVLAVYLIAVVALGIWWTTATGRWPS